MKFSHKVVAGALSVALMGSVLYISSSNETDYVEIQNQVQINNKKKVDLQAEKRDPIIPDVPPGQNSGGSSSNFQVKGNGKPITDVSKNPIGAPVYDGLTRNDPLYETDYEAIRSSNQDNPLKDLGDYSVAGQGEIITIEHNQVSNASGWSGSRYGTGGAMKANRDLLSKTTDGQYWMINGRLAVCLTGMVVMSPEDQAKVGPLCSVESNYNFPGSRSGLTTGKCYEPSLKLAPSWHNDSQGSKYFNFDVDLVLDNGTVLAVTIVDYKGIQIGSDSGALYDCTKVKGYCHYQGNKDNTNWRVCTLEVQTTGSLPGSTITRRDFCLEGHKIVKAVTYPGIIKWK